MHAMHIQHGGLPCDKFSTARFSHALHSPTWQVGVASETYPDLCERCVPVVTAMGFKPIAVPAAEAAKQPVTAA